MVPQQDIMIGSRLKSSVYAYCRRGNFKLVRTPPLTINGCIFVAGAIHVSGPEWPLSLDGGLPLKNINSTWLAGVA
jgi:hypothetical protein